MNINRLAYPSYFRPVEAVFFKHQFDQTKSDDIWTHIPDSAKKLGDIFVITFFFVVAQFQRPTSELKSTKFLGIFNG